MTTRRCTNKHGQTQVLLFKDYNYKPTTKIDKGIEEFVSWYKDYHKNL